MPTDSRIRSSSRYLARRALAIPVAALLFVCAIAPTVAAPPPPGWSGPEVIAGEKLGPLSIPVSPNQLTIGSLAVPSGKWVAYAKFEARVPIESSTIDVACDFLAGPRTDQSRQHGEARIGLAGLGEIGGANFSFNLAHTFGRGGGTFRIRCEAQAAGVSARLIRIMAMRVGTLTTVALANGSTATTGSGQPVVVHGRRSSSVDIPASDAFSPIATLDLPDGRWWIRADLYVTQGAPHGPNPAVFACRLTAGGEADALRGSLEFIPDATMVDFNVASTLTSRNGEVVLSCMADGPGVNAEHIRITAVKAGTLTKVSLVTGSSTTTGSGKPVIVHGRRVLAPGVTDSWTTIGQINRPQGNWVASAKVSTTHFLDASNTDERADAPIDCQLLDGIDSDASYEEYPPYGRTLALQVADKGGSQRTQLTLRCRALEAEPGLPTEVRYAKITALKAATLVFDDL